MKNGSALIAGGSQHHLLRFTVQRTVRDTYWFVVTDDLDHMTTLTHEALAQRCHPSPAFQRAFDLMVRDLTSTPAAPRHLLPAAQRWCRQPAALPHDGNNPLHVVPVLREIARANVTPTEVRTGTRDDMDAALGRVVWLCPAKFAKGVPVIANAITPDELTPDGHPCPCARVSDMTAEWVRRHPLVTGRKKMVFERVKSLDVPPVDVPDGVTIDLTW